MEAARLEVELQRRRDARRIHYEQKTKRLRLESWALRQRAALMGREADEVDGLVERKMREGTFDDDSESELSESNVMACHDDEEERATPKFVAPTRRKPLSEHRPRIVVMLYQPQQGVSLQR